MEDLKSLHALGQHVSQEQDRAISAAELGPVRQAFLERQLATASASRRQPLPTRGRWLVLAAAALAMAAGVFVAWATAQAGDTGRLQVKVNGAPVEPEALDSWWSAPAHARLPIEFSDGTKVGLAAKSRARVLQVTQHGAHLVLESGASSVEVVPREASSWQVSAGPFLVQVVGTSFDVEWGPDEDLFVLRLHKGKVNLSGCVFGSGRSVVAGETVTASCKSRHYEIATRSAQSEAKARVAEAALAPTSSAQPTDAKAAPAVVGGDTPAQARAPSWRKLARAGKYAEAIEAATLAGFNDELDKASAEDLSLLGDAARFAGKPRKAILAYEKLRSRYSGTSRAATAAYSLARTHFDQQGAYGQAARWFQTYLTEQPSGPLAREARGRLMESLNRSGDTAGARRIAEGYLKRYPSGPHAPLAESLLPKQSR